MIQAVYNSKYKGRVQVLRAADLRASTVFFRRCGSVLNGCSRITHPLFFSPLSVALARFGCGQKSRSPLIKCVKRIATNLPVKAESFIRSILLAQIKKPSRGAPRPVVPGFTHAEIPRKKHNHPRPVHAVLYEVRVESPNPES